MLRYVVVVVVVVGGGGGGGVGVVGVVGVAVVFLAFTRTSDIAPEGATLEESNRNLDEITDLALELQAQTGVKLLWGTCNLFAHSR